MKKITIASYLLIILVLAAATVVEKFEGSDTAYAVIYSSLWFKILWGVLVAGALVAIRKNRMWKNIPSLLLHVSFMVILLGALITSLFSSEQVMHLREGESSGETLPFSLTLRKFELKTYPGTDRRQDFVSHIEYKDGEENGTYDISMNRIFSHGGYRFYQSSYDDDLHGTVLTVKHDPWGIGVTYTGYGLLLVSMIMVLVNPKGRFRKILSECMSKGVLSLLVILTLGGTANAQASSTHVPRAVTKDMAEQLSRKLVVYNGRIVPIRTLALDFCQKVTGKRSFGGLSAEHFMVSLMVYPEDWKGVHMIKVEDAALREALGIEGKRGALADFFAADGTYRMDAIYQRHKSTDDAMEKAILKVDERCALVVMLINGELVKPVPAGVERPSEAVVSAEILYDAAPWSLILFIVTFVMSVVLLFLVLSGKATVLNIPANVVVLVDTVALVVLYGLRWAIQGHVPMSNGYETMLFIALVAQLFAASLVVGRISRISLLTALAMIISAFALLVSHLSFMSPEMTPLMPVLQSPLLSIHVSTIMVAYALFAILTLVSVAALIAYRRGGAQAEHMTLVCELLLYPAVFLLTTGIFLGAVWANVSWGTYWSWDPKETWALITLMVYAAPLHRHSVRMFSEPRKYHIYIICAFVSVLVTYFGVNYLLGGMHSYA